MARQGKAAMSAALDPRHAREEAFDRELRAYIMEVEAFRFGGLANLCTTLASICEQEELNTRNASYGVAAAEFRRLESALDLDYEPRRDEE
ncbi:MAG: hypothetical protein NUV51_03600 [Sulfuricaulis sp.]|nr:hypothetical protein [Sulfuricaulis sp.]